MDWHVMVNGVSKPVTWNRVGSPSVSWTSRGESGVQASSSSVPALASTAGYNTLAFVDDFTDPATVDLTGNPTSSTLWYSDVPWNGGRVAQATISNSVLTLNQSASNFNYGLATVSPTLKQGKAFHYGYFEAKMRFDPSPAASVPDFTWPSFWAMSQGHLFNTDNVQVAELDFYEAWHTLGQPYNNKFATNMHQHDQQPDGSFTHKDADGGEVLSIDYSQWHTYSCLWQPGHVQWFLDGTKHADQQYSATAAPIPNPFGYGAGVFSCFDNNTIGQLGIILGTGAGFPFDVDWVRIWQ